MRSLGRLPAVLPTLLLMACGVPGPALMPPVSSPQASPPQPGAGFPLAYPSTGSTPRLLLFGGVGHKTYLGCVSCSQYDPESVFNEYGLHGSKYAVDSILNAYGQYGSPYSAYSACNPYATDAPVIVDGNGQFYGRLTLNVYNSQRTKTAALLTWLAGVCQR